MFNNTEWFLIAAWFITLMMAVWINHRRGFVTGVNQGYLAGIYFTVKYIMAEDLITVTRTDDDGKERPATQEELTGYIKLEIEKSKNILKEQG